MRRRKPKTATATRWAGGLCGIGLLGWAVLLGACRDPDKASGTALYVTIQFSPALQMDQLRVSGNVAEDPIGPYLLPVQPERMLSSGETFRVLLPSAPHEATASLHLEGMREGAPVARGLAQAQVREGYEVDVTVHLAPDGESFCLNCPEGCCMSGFCTTSTFNTCGTGGIACVQCDPRTADACAPAGFCGCGQGAACDALTTDRCEGGQCRCGNGGPCGYGQQCVAGQCRCTPESCQGCCDGNTCEPGHERTRCGVGGVACRSCSRVCRSDGSCG